MPEMPRMPQLCIPSLLGLSSQDPDLRVGMGCGTRRLFPQVYKINVWPLSTVSVHTNESINHLVRPKKHLPDQAFLNLGDALFLFPCRLWNIDEDRITDNSSLWHIKLS